ncbi:hypothetical protein S40293_01538 [Stachybotrys chartarum IBT 40293]|nr:hypothetical protein S40293_01538 [Stachybotrys chartarum IBT 40293]
MATIAFSEIPTVSALYRSASLALASSAAAKYPPSAALNKRIGLIRADITRLDVDALVNAANSRLAGGGGVDGSIHRAAGPELLDACDEHGGCPTGEARLTPGFRLPARHVIHAVGPRYGSGPSERAEALLRSCYLNSLRIAEQEKMKSVAFSCISTGIYGYPHAEAARVACDTVRNYLEKEESGLERVVFVTFTPKDVETYDEILPLYFPPAE